MIAADDRRHFRRTPNLFRDFDHPVFTTERATSLRTRREIVELRFSGIDRACINE
jgi:hypothetical protein